ncbi:hypothetical protein [Klebsiella oxytoca]|uniref:hypothetical protein n=1 Tax=Klebsiella oxytoca TaxID=571 RepID=UPI001EF911C1|nr:hypothetical protein [Klebsiella oxytoca]
MQKNKVRVLSLASFPLMLLLAGVSVTHADTDVYFSGNLIADPCELHVDSEGLC